MKVSIVFMTARQEPMLEWVVEDIAKQCHDGDEIELLVIDFFGRPLSNQAHVVLGAMRNHGLRVSSTVSKPKPTIWQGEHRITTDDHWATANARNTALVLAQHEFVAFLDDRCHLGPAWLDTVRQYEAHRAAVLVGSYDKHEDGAITSRDHRREIKPNGQRNCHPGWLYGCSFALPLDWALEVNGFEEGTDGLTGEDYIFGLMLGNADHPLDFVPDMFVRQDRTKGNVTCKGIYKCKDKGVSPNDKSHAALERFGAKTRTEFTPNLRTLRRQRREAVANGRRWTFPVPDPTATYLDWYDDQDIRTM